MSEARIEACFVEPALSLDGDVNEATLASPLRSPRGSSRFESSEDR